MKKTTWIIGAVLIFLLTAVIVGNAVVYSHGFEFNGEFQKEVADMVMLCLIVLGPVISVMVAWEQGNYIWMVIAGFAYLNILPGTSMGGILSLVVPPLFFVFRFNSWRLFIRKLRKKSSVDMR